MKIEPFLKWPGGKRWLVKQHAELFQSKFDRYVEPFLGSGAVFFHLTPSDALLADTNSELINLYRCIKRHAGEIDKRLQKLQKNHGAELYYKMRKRNPRQPLERAVRFLYLNRTCFNGIYRVNQSGQFNVPMGSKTDVAFPDGYLDQVALILRAATFRIADFEEIIDSTGKGDLVFVDPPYTVMHNNNNFIKYNAHLFSWDDQQRLARAVRRAVRRGANVIVANADHQTVKDLYKGLGTHLRLGRATVLAAESQHRRSTTELIVTTIV